MKDYDMSDAEKCGINPKPVDCKVDGCSFNETGHCDQHPIEVERRINTAKEMKALKDEIKDAYNRLGGVYDKVNSMKDSLKKDIADVRQDIDDKDKALSNKQSWILGTITVFSGVYLLVTTGSYLYTTISTANNKTEIRANTAGLVRLTDTVIRTEERLAITSRTVDKAAGSIDRLAKLQAELAAAYMYVEDWEALKRAMDHHEMKERQNAK
jgi:membrane-associated HD superfamily phosphohydrolase